MLDANDDIPTAIAIIAPATVVVIISRLRPVVAICPSVPPVPLFAAIVSTSAAALARKP
jgi:hypothetical protein